MAAFKSKKIVPGKYPDSWMRNSTTQEHNPQFLNNNEIVTISGKESFPSSSYLEILIESFKKKIRSQDYAERINKTTHENIVNVLQQTHHTAAIIEKSAALITSGKKEFDMYRDLEPEERAALDINRMLVNSRKLFDLQKNISKGRLSEALDELSHDMHKIGNIRGTDTGPKMEPAGRTR